ncbi:MAG TPA: PIN domain-containing protein [Steroidobacteraceae bacterium]|jgi:hypothetical protein|nr:PIN domain-containing protein [Steroidobacteraceae bacterium]
MGKLDTGQRDRRTPERLEASHRGASAFDSHEIPIAQPVGDVPANAQLDDLGIEAATSVHGISGNGRGHLGISGTPELYDNAPNATEPYLARYNLGRKLVEKFNFPRRDADLVGDFLRRVSIVVEPTDLPRELCRDPTDLPVLGTAFAGACALLGSVDRDLLDMQKIQAIPIIRPGEYWRRTTETK